VAAERPCGRGHGARLAIEAPLGALECAEDPALRELAERLGGGRPQVAHVDDQRQPAQPGGLRGGEDANTTSWRGAASTDAAAPTAKVP